MKIPAIWLLLLITCLQCTPTFLWAVNENNRANQSIGTLNVSADFAGTALINNLTDMAFTSLNPVAALSNKENVCVFANSILGGTYSITATGNGTGGAFTVSNGVSTVPYTVNWANTSGASSGTALTSGVALNGQTTGLITSICLLGITDATLFVSFSLAALQSARSGSFTGVLTLLITPV